MTIMQKTQNKECWTLSPNPRNTHSDKHELRSEGVADIDDSPVLVANSFKKTNFPEKTKSPREMGKSKKAGKTLAHTKEQTPQLPLSGNLQENLESSLGNVDYRDSIYSNTRTRNVVPFTAKRDSENIIDCKTRRVTAMCAVVVSKTSCKDRNHRILRGVIAPHQDFFFLQKS